MSNGHTALPTLTFGERCDYEMLDVILNGSQGPWGWGVRVWFKQGVAITARWGGSSWEYEDGESESYTMLLAWSEKERDYVNEIVVPTDDITRLEIL